MSTNASDDGSLSFSAEGSANGASKAIMIGKFRLLAILGKGSMGKVVRAEDIKLKRQVALKCMRPKKNGSTYRVEQFVREARSAAALEHPNIVHIYEVGEAGAYHYIAMELIEGGDLGSLIKGIGALDMHRACQLGAEAAEALAHAAQLGVVHRDIKPQNLMLTRSGRCKITDFGLARIDDPSDGFSMPAGAVGTPTYMAPEVIRHETATPKSDVYSLGCVLFYLLTGRPPFPVREREQLLKAHLETPAPNVCSVRPDLPESLGKVISRALAKEPEERPTADMLAKQLRAHTIPIGSGSIATAASSSLFVAPAPAPVAAAGSEPPKKPRAFLLGAIVGTAAVLVCVAGVYVITSHNNLQPALASAPMAMPAPAAAPAVIPAAASPAAPTQAAMTPAPAQPQPQLAAVVAPAAAPATPTAPSAPAANDPAPDLRAAVARPGAPVDEVLSRDAPALLAAGKENKKITVVGVISAVHIDGAQKLATLTFRDNSDLTVTYSARLYSAMTKKFGGHDGNGLIAKSVRITGYTSLLNGKPDMTVNAVSQIELTP